MILKSGRVVFTETDPTHSVDTLHGLWSASKSISATLIGAAIEQGWLSEEMPLSQFFSAKEGLSDAMASIKVEDLLSMSSGILWNEIYDAKLKDSTFLPMLYGFGKGDMLSYVFSQPMDYLPGTKWNYNGGNSFVLMAILKKIARSRSLSSQGAAEHLLFNKLGIKNAFFETDGQGVPVGNSYAYMSIKDMLKLGDLYLNQGRWGAQRILSTRWVSKGQELSAGLLDLSVIKNRGMAKFEQFKKSVIKEGVYGQTGFWLNKDVPEIMFNEFKNSPKDLYFAAGHFGQIIMVIPSQKMVIARTGRDKEYWSKIDSLSSAAVKCFSSKSWGLK